MFFQEWRLGDATMGNSSNANTLKRISGFEADVESSAGVNAVNENVFNISSDDKTQSIEIKYHRSDPRHESRKVLHAEDKSVQLEKLQCNGVPAVGVEARGRRRRASLSRINPNNGVTMQCVFEVHRYSFQARISRTIQRKKTRHTTWPGWGEK